MNGNLILLVLIYALLAIVLAYAGRAVVDGWRWRLRRQLRRQVRFTFEGLFERDVQ